MKSKKEKESAKGGPSNKGKHTTCSPLPSLTPKVTRFLEEHYEASYKYIYAKKEMIKLKYVDMAWLKSERFAFLELIEYHELQKLVEMKGTYYPILIRFSTLLLTLMVILHICVLR